MKLRWLLILLPIIASAQTPTSIPQLYAQHPAAPLNGGEIVPMQQGAETVAALASQFATYIGSNIFVPGCALGGSFNSQTVNLSAGVCIIGSLPLSNIAFNSTAPVTLGLVGPIPSWVHVGFQVPYTFFSTAATTNSVALFSLPPSGVIQGCKIKHSASFSGGSISAYTVSVGDSGSAVAYTSPFNVHQATGATTYQLSQSFGGESSSASTLIYLTATSTGGNLNTATAGQLDVWCLISVAL